MDKVGQTPLLATVTHPPVVEGVVFIAVKLYNHLLLPTILRLETVDNGFGIIVEEMGILEKIVLFRMEQLH